MIELLFSDSGAAALGMAKQTGDKSTITRVEICTTPNGEETLTNLPPEPFTGTAVHGDISEVMPIWLMGDVGDISKLPNWLSRTALLQEITILHEMEAEPWIAQESSRAEASIRRLRHAAQSGEAIRIWWSATADETCGYYWAMSLLKNAAGPVTGIKIPCLWPYTNDISPTSGTGDLKPEDFSTLLGFERAIALPERAALARHWERLKAENAPLRAVINGIPCSVPEHFYDNVLYQVFPSGTFKVVEAIGLALGNMPCGVHDWWYARRIRHLIACGELEVVESHAKFYYTTVRKRTYDHSTLKKA